jgi:methylenetetrahydrofolate reductase (NADPH)
MGVEVMFVTQFFFDAAPFLQWLSRLRAAGIRSPVIAGLAGPAGLATLFKFAVRCGVGPSIRALGARPAAFTKILAEHGPESVLTDLAQARADHTTDLSGIHLFGFGGFRRTCEWVQAVSEGRFTVHNGRFDATRS